MKSTIHLICVAACAMAASFTTTQSHAEDGAVLYRMPPIDQVITTPDTLYRGQLGTTIVEEVSYLGSMLAGDKGKSDGCGKAGCNNCRTGCVDSAQLFIDFDSWAARLDDDDWNNFGTRLGTNVARRFRDTNLFWQAGMVYGVYDWDGHEMGDSQDNEEQIFITIGGFRRANLCAGRVWTFGGTIDYLHDENIGELHNQSVDLYQTRYRLGRALSDANEIGIIGALHIGPDRTITGTNQGDIRVSALDHASVYWDHRFANNSRIMTSLGWLAEPGELLFGVNGEVPFNDYFTMYGNFNYGKPSTQAGDLAGNNVEQSYSEAYWNVSFGLVYYFRGAVGAESTPLMPVAGNGNFMVAAPNGAL